MSFPSSLIATGNSLSRGLILSLIDILLPTFEEKVGFGGALNKCWGYFNVQIGAVNLIYQDFRKEAMRRSSTMEDANEFSPPDSYGCNDCSEDDKILCHDDKIAVSGERKMKRDGLVFVRDFLFSETRQDVWPEVLFVTNENFGVVRDMIKVLPKNWSGTVVLLNTDFGMGLFVPTTVVGNEGQYLRNSFTEVFQEREKIRIIVASDPRIVLLNATMLHYGMIHNMQDPPLMNKWHHHFLCHAENTAVDSKSIENNYCGNSMEFLSHVALDLAFDAGEVSQSVSKRRKETAAFSESAAKNSSSVLKTEIRRHKKILHCQDW